MQLRWRQRRSRRRDRRRDPKRRRSALADWWSRAVTRRPPETEVLVFSRRGDASRSSTTAEHDRSARSGGATRRD